MKVDKEEVMRQIRGVLRRTEKLIARAETEEGRATGLAMCEGYLQAFYFCGVINREEYKDFRQDLQAFRRLDNYRRGLERKDA